MALSVIVPIGLAVTIPSTALVGRLSWIGVIAAIGLAGAVLAGSRRLFRRGIRSYSGASS